jgi:hypothetical protein
LALGFVGFDKKPSERLLLIPQEIFFVFGFADFVEFDKEPSERLLIIP